MGDIRLDCARFFPRLFLVRIFQSIVSVSLLLVGYVAFSVGILFNAVFLFLVTMALVSVGYAITAGIRGGLEWSFWKKPFAPNFRAYLRQALARSAFWITSAALVNICLVPAQLRFEVYRGMMFGVWALAALLCGLTLLPAKRVLLPLNLAYAAATCVFIWQFIEIAIPPPTNERVVLSSPFDGDWVAVQAGNSSVINSHFRLISQRYAVDFSRVIVGEGFSADRLKRESYSSWNAVILAPANGTVVEAVGDLPDNQIGQTDRAHLVGNHVTIDIGHGHFVLMAHLQQGSVQVAVGDTIKAGQSIARCGNSGNTTMPHLHLQVQDRAAFSFQNLRTFPMAFTDVTATRAGRTRLDTPFVLRRNDEIIFGGSEVTLPK